MTDRDWSEAELAKVEDRDGLASRNLRGERLTDRERARLDELNEWLDSIYPESPGLPAEVLRIVDEVLKGDGG